MQTIINFHNETNYGEESLPLGYEEVYMDAENFNKLFLNVFTSNDGRMTLELGYAPTLYDLPTAQRMIQHIKNLMLGMVSDANQTIAILRKMVT